MKRITVATVCFNAKDTIKLTIESVLNQNYKNYEYLIIDGESEDDTLEIVNSYKKDFERKKIDYRIISEKDNGIFDAMNKAASLSNSEWIIYMNADDEFNNANVLLDVEKYLTDDADVVYGNTVRINENKKEFAEAKPFDVIYKGMPFCHQSCFTRTELVKNYTFDLKYRVSDYNLFLTLAIDKKNFLKTDITIANYSTTGYSNKNKYKTYKSILDIKHDKGLLNKNSIKQKIKNVYFYILLNENNVFHGIIYCIDRKFHGKR